MKYNGTGDRRDSETIGPLNDERIPVTLLTSDRQIADAYNSGGPLTFIDGYAYSGHGSDEDYRAAREAVQCNRESREPLVTDVPKRPLPKLIEPSNETVGEMKARRKRLAKRKTFPMILFASLLALAVGCEELRRNGRPGDPYYIAPVNVSVKVIEFEPEFAGEVAGKAVIRNAYSVVESEEGKRYRVTGKVGPVGDTFTMDVSLMNEIGG